MNNHEGLLTEVPMPIESVEGLAEKVLTLVEAVVPTVEIDTLHPSINNITSVFTPEDGVVVQITQAYSYSSYEKDDIEASAYRIRLAVLGESIDFEEEPIDEHMGHEEVSTTWVREYRLTNDCELTLGYSSTVTPNHEEVYDGKNKITKVSIEDVDPNKEGVEYDFQYGYVDSSEDDDAVYDEDDDEEEIVAAYSIEEADPFESQVSTHQAHYLISLLEKLAIEVNADGVATDN